MCRRSVRTGVGEPRAARLIPSEVANLLHGEEISFYGDSAYRGQAQRERLKVFSPKAKDFTNKRACRNKLLSEADKETNRRKSGVCSEVEPPFLVIKRRWGFAKVRYRGLAKNANRAFAMLAMANLVKRGGHSRPISGPGFFMPTMKANAFNVLTLGRVHIHATVARVLNWTQHSVAAPRRAQLANSPLTASLRLVLRSIQYPPGGLKYRARHTALRSLCRGPP